MKFQLGICAVVMAGITMASGQVASHKSTVTKATPAAKTAKKSASAPVQTFPVRIIAKVNGAPLTEIDLVREMYAMFPYSKQHNGFPKSMEPEMRRGALEMIIFQELLYQDAKRRNVGIPEAEIKRAEVEFRKQFANDAEYKQFLQVEVGGSPAKMREKIRRSLLIEKMLKTEVTQKASPTPAAVKFYYDNNPKEFTHGEMIHIQSISIIPPQGASNDVLKEAAKRAADAAKEAKKKTEYEPFGLLAEKISDDDFHVNMGDHKDRPAEQLPAEIVAAARKMKVGQVSDLIRLGPNYTVFRLVAYSPAGKTPFAKAKDEIYKKLLSQKTEQVRSALNKNLQKNAKIERL